jgi:hypothetical protein
MVSASRPSLYLLSREAVRFGGWPLRMSALVVSYLADPKYARDGTYSFSDDD